MQEHFKIVMNAAGNARSYSDVVRRTARKRDECHKHSITKRNSDNAKLGDTPRRMTDTVLSSSKYRQRRETISAAAAAARRSFQRRSVSEGRASWIFSRSLSAVSGRFDVRRRPASSTGGAS